MRGLKTQEGNSFIAFFQLVQAEAQKQNSVFFLECGEGNDFVGDNIEGEDLRGWLVPAEQADEFEREWMNGDPGSEWENHIVWVLWKGDTNKPTVEIKRF
jgi:hypothetical protein